MPLTVEVGGRAAIYDLRTAFELLSDDVDPVDLIRAVDAGDIVTAPLRNGGLAMVSAPGEIPPELRKTQLALIPYLGNPDLHCYEVGVQLLFPIRATVLVHAQNAEDADCIIDKVLHDDEPMEEHGFELDFNYDEVAGSMQEFLLKCRSHHPAELGIEHHLVETAFTLIEGG